MLKFIPMLEKILITLAHFALLYWIFYVLYESGTIEVKTMMFHFLGMAAFGAFLIRGTAWIVHRRFLKENNLKKL